MLLVFSQHSWAAPHCMHCLLRMCQRMTQNVPYVKATVRHLLETCIMHTSSHTEMFYLQRYKGSRGYYPQHYLQLLKLFKVLFLIGSLICLGKWKEVSLSSWFLKGYSALSFILQCCCRLVICPFSTCVLKTECLFSSDIQTARYIVEII